MTPTNPGPETTTEVVARARGLAVVVGGAVVVGSALAWGRPGLVAAAAGTALAVANVFALTRFAETATVVAASVGPNTAYVRLTSALGAKTALLLGGVWLVLKSLHPRTLPFALGLLVTVFCLLGAGLATAWRTDSRE